MQNAENAKDNMINYEKRFQREKEALQIRREEERIAQRAITDRHIKELRSVIERITGSEGGGTQCARTKLTRTKHIS